MFTGKICLASVLLSLHAVNCYILLTANLDDMHSLAKQIAESPVANQINEIIRRAATIIKETGVPVKKLTRKAHMPSDSKLDLMNETDVGEPQGKEGAPQTNGDQDNVEKTDQNQPEIEKPDQNRPEIEKTDQNSAEGQKVSSNSDTDTESENKNQNLEPWKPAQEDLAAELNGKASHSSIKVSEETNKLKPQHSSRREVGFAELGRNASYYLNSIKKIFENI